MFIETNGCIMSKEQDVVDESELIYSDAYADYIMANSDGERLICDGDSLLVAMETVTCSMTFWIA